jgi:hypothetical protein
MIQALKAGEIDVGIGLTEGWVAGLGKKHSDDKEYYQIVGTYVETPLCRFVSTFYDLRSLGRVKDIDRELFLYRISRAIKISHSHLSPFENYSL